MKPCEFGVMQYNWGQSTFLPIPHSDQHLPEVSSKNNFWTTGIQPSFLYRTRLHKYPGDQNCMARDTATAASNLEVSS